MLRRAGFWRTEAAKFLMADAEGGGRSGLGEAVVWSSALERREEEKVRRVVDAEMVWPALEDGLVWSSLRTCNRSARKQDVHIEVLAISRLYVHGHLEDGDLQCLRLIDQENEASKLQYP